MRNFTILIVLLTAFSGCMKPGESVLHGDHELATGTAWARGLTAKMVEMFKKEGVIPDDPLFELVRAGYLSSSQDFILFGRVPEIDLKELPVEFPIEGNPILIFYLYDGECRVYYVGFSDGGVEVVPDYGTLSKLLEKRRADLAATGFSRWENSEDRQAEVRRVSQQKRPGN